MRCGRNGVPELEARQAEESAVRWGERYGGFERCDGGQAEVQICSQAVGGRKDRRQVGVGWVWHHLLRLSWGGSLCWWSWSW